MMHVSPNGSQNGSRATDVRLEHKLRELTIRSASRGRTTALGRRLADGRVDD